METIQLGQSSLKASRLAYGCWRIAGGWEPDRVTAEDIQAAYPYVSLPQIHAALGYYYDHQDACDRQIDQRRQRADELLPQLENAALQERLRRQKAGA